MRFLGFASLLCCLGVSTVFAQNGFQTHSYPTTGGKMLLGDFNNDGSPDLLVYGGPPILMLNDHHGGFGTSKPFPTTQQASYVAVADFNNDGIPDVVACLFDTQSETSSLAVFLNDGSGNFTQSDSK